jgi:hypothetical protein
MQSHSVYSGYFLIIIGSLLIFTKVPIVSMVGMVLFIFGLLTPVFRQRVLDDSDKASPRGNSTTADETQNSHTEAIDTNSINNGASQGSKPLNALLAKDLDLYWDLYELYKRMVEGYMRRIQEIATRKIGVYELVELSKRKVPAIQLLCIRLGFDKLEWNTQLVEKRLEGMINDSQIDSKVRNEAKQTLDKLKKLPIVRL